MDTYDSPWKEALSHFFPDFMAFYFPLAYAAIDWSQPPTLASRGDVERRYAAKRHLTHLLYQRGWNERSIMELYRVIDWMMHLPEELTQRLHREVAVWEQEKEMRYITSIERLGRKEGRIEGKKEGKIEGKRDLLAELLCQRFDASMRTVRARLAGASDAQLECWARRLFSAASLDEVLRGE